MEIKLNLTEEQAEKILRALDRSASHWADLDHIRRYENAMRISRSYRDLAKEVRNQMQQQGV